MNSWDPQSCPSALGNVKDKQISLPLALKILHLHCMFMFKEREFPTPVITFESIETAILPLFVFLKLTFITVLSPVNNGSSGIISIITNIYLAHWDVPNVYEALFFITEFSQQPLEVGSSIVQAKRDMEVWESKWWIWGPNEDILSPVPEV